MDHAKILSGYLSRLTVNDLDLIYSTQISAIQAGLNGGVNEQIQKGKDCENAIRKGINNLLYSDLKTIENILKEEV